MKRKSLITTLIAASLLSLSTAARAEGCSKEADAAARAHCIVSQGDEAAWGSKTWNSPQAVANEAKAEKSGSAPVTTPAAVASVR